MSEKLYSFIFSDGCFDREKQRAEIARTKRPYNREVYNMNRAVEELDRYDDFDSLRIANNQYEHTDGSGVYGIPFDREKHVQGSVIFKHQNSATVAFLKDLRGFGLLADVVGSGKTFEAALILSELAVRGKIQSMLLVVPGQVYDSWVNVLEIQFGLGKGILFEADSNFKSQSDFIHAGIKFDGQNRPNRPIIVKTEDFVSWDNSLTKCLFDVIVVDEAHHLSKAEGEYATAMQLLSRMMETKKLANITYCLLLSATPHSGNLAHMFRLWYFIRCKGGHPSDFEEKEAHLYSEEYKKEKAYYTERVCRNATTVMEFIKRVKKSELLLNYSEPFEKFLATQKLTLDAFMEKVEGEQQMWVDEFLKQDNDKEIEKINEKIMKTVANAYHNGVLRSIMIRQPSTELVKKHKYLVNYLYYPALKKGSVKISDDYGNNFLLDLERMYEDAPVVTIIDEKGRVTGEKMSLSEYVHEYHGDLLTEQQYHSNLIGNIFEQTVDESQFSKKNSKQYYAVQMSFSRDQDLRCELRPMFSTEDFFIPKFEDAKKILRKHRDEKVLVFFDYELRKKEILCDRFLEELRKIPEFASRIVIGTATNKEKTLVEFEQKKNAVIVIKDSSFTEGVNLQSGNVIINFQITPDPLAMDQRIGRIFRLGQKNDVTIYSLAATNQIEGYALMYFARIGLMSSNSGDATIIAGSNNERMIAIRCEHCGQVQLLSQEDYETYKKQDADRLYCTGTPECRARDARGTLMKEISVYDFKCDRCSSIFVRSVADESGYMCMAHTNTTKGTMCNRGEKGDRRVYCRKICAMAHCSRFTPATCPAVAAYLKNRSIGDQDLYSLCNSCQNKSRCPERCRPYTGAEAISSCSTCTMSACQPKPHVIEFDDHWEADCPVCKSMGARKRGKLRPVVARTFAAYLRAAWNFNHDNGEGFCNNLLNEAGKVEDIKQVLDADNNK